MIKYAAELSRINTYLSQFNSYLKPEFAFDLFNLELIDQQDIFLSVVDKIYGDIQFPKNSESAGVYFYFATSENDSSDRRIYIGKASYTRSVGLRLYNHFRDRFKYNNFIEVCNGISYRIEMMTSIAVPNTSMAFFASALEEFLIVQCQRDSIKLLNKIGNNGN